MTPVLPENAACSFCGKGPAEVERLIAGPEVWICDGCVRVCHGILETVDGQQPPRPDALLADIARAQHMALIGERAGAAAAFAEIWGRLDPDGDPFPRATVAHYTADLQDDPDAELEWDLRALAAADSIPDGSPAATEVRGLYPSLHLNIAADLDGLGRCDEAREHLAAAEAAQMHLPPDGYGRLVRAEIAALRERLGR
jgi:hypothetical protein